MLSIVLAIVASTSLNLVVSHVASKYTYNIAFVLLMVESLKLLLCSIGMRLISNKNYFKIRWGFLVNALLYSVVNVLTHHITILVPSSIYNVLIQHKILWVVIFSIIILKRHFSKIQYMSLILILTGCILLKMTDTSSSISNMGIILIVLQGICSSLSSVWIEKMMKKEERCIISEDEKKQKLYWFLNDSFQMYMFGIPVYIIGNYTTNISTVDVPFHLYLLMILISVINGIALGAIFVYYSSVVRSMISAIVIVFLSLHHGQFTLNIILGISLVLLGILGWTYKR
jgi:drug/metabolite transporter (DMT)-like permease